MVTKEQAIAERYFIDASGHKWRKNGKCMVWTRNINKFKVPIKHGLYAYAYITDENCSQFFVDTGSHT